MSVPHLLGVLALDLPDHVEFAILVRLADIARKRTGIARATTRYLAKRCGNMDRGALDRGLHRLEKAGHIRSEERQGRNTPSRWTLLVTPVWRSSEATEDAVDDAPVAAPSAAVAAPSAAVAAQNSQDPVLDPVNKPSESARGGSKQPRGAESSHGSSVAAENSHGTGTWVSGPKTLQRAQPAYSARSEASRAKRQPRPFETMTDEEIADHVRSLDTRYPQNELAIGLTVKRIRAKHPRVSA